MRIIVKGFVSTAMIFALWVAGLNDVKATTLNCEDCSYSYMQLFMFNYMNSLQAPISDTVYVVNRNDNIVRKYQISKEYALGSCPPGPADCLTETEMIPMTVEQSVIQYVSVASQAPQIDR